MTALNPWVPLDTWEAGGWRWRIKVGADGLKRNVIVRLPWSGAVVWPVPLVAFRPWEQAFAAAIKGAENLPEPVATLVTAAACKGQQWSGELPELTQAGAARRAIPQVCQTDLVARLGAESIELATRRALAASAVAVLVVAGKAYNYFNRPVESSFLEPALLSPGQASRPGPQRRPGVPALTGKTVLRAANRGSASSLKA